MKKFLLVILVIGVFSSMFFTGCKDNKSNSTTTAPDPMHLENLDYFMAVASENYKGMYYIFIDSYNENATINTAALTINGIDIPLISEGYEGWVSWFGSVELTQGQDIVCVLNINGNSYNLNLTVPYHPNLTWPESYNPGVSTTLSWTLSGDSEYQYFEGDAEGFDYETMETIEESKYVTLDQSDRSFTIPANWLNSDLDEYEFDLLEYSFEADGKVGAAIGDGSEATYYPDIKKSDRRKEMHLILKKIIKKNH